MKKRSACLLALLCLGLPSAVAAALVTFSNLASFQAATTGLTLEEDFESVTPKNTALSSFTSNGNTHTGFAGSPFPNVFISGPGFTN